MGFEAKYPDNWHVRSVTVNRPGIESAMVDETPRVGKPHLAAQFWVQRRANPDDLPIEQWYAAQLRAMKASPPPILITAIGWPHHSPHGSQRNLGKNVPVLHLAQ